MILLETWVQSALNSTLVLALPVAVLAGLLSFASPCVLPLLPAYLSYATGLGAAELAAGGRRRTVLVGTLGFVLGFAIVFVATGAVIGGIGSALLESSRTITVVVGLVTIVLGAMFAGLIPIRREWRVKTMPKFSVAASPLLGAVFALGWTPCIGPALATVLTLAINDGSASKGAILAFAYAIGLGLPFIAFGVWFAKMKRPLAWLQSHQRGIQLFGGLLLMAVGVALVTGLWDQLMAIMRQWLVNFEAPI